MHYDGNRNGNKHENLHVLRFYWLYVQHVVIFSLTLLLLVLLIVTCPSNTLLCRPISALPINSLHATDLYIDFMNNSLAKKEIMKKERKKLPNRGTNSRRIYENGTSYPPSHARIHNVFSLYGPYKPIRSVWLRYYHATLPRAMS